MTQQIYSHRIGDLTFTGPIVRDNGNGQVLIRHAFTVHGELRTVDIMVSRRNLIPVEPVEATP